MKSFLMTCFLAVQMPLALANWQGVVEQVVSGDTLRVHYQGGLYDVRLSGVATPKINQSYGPSDKDATSKVILGRSVDVERIYADGNTDVAIVYIHDQYSVQSYLAGSGLAWVNGRQCTVEVCSKWQTMQDQARSAQRGLWADANPVPPWNWGVRSKLVKKKVNRQKAKKPVMRARKHSVPHDMAAPAPDGTLQPPVEKQIAPDNQKTVTEHKPMVQSAH